jgi:hypothetical protein
MDMVMVMVKKMAMATTKKTMEVAPQCTNSDIALIMTMGQTCHSNIF